MSEYGTVVADQTIRFERLLPGPVERVWEYLTDSEKRGKWLAAGPMELRPGGRADVTFRHSDLSPSKEPTPERFKHMENGVDAHWQVVECDEPRLLVIRWERGSEVKFELAPAGERVRLVVTHSKLSDRGMMVNVGGGWHTHLAILEDVLNGAEPRPFWSSHAQFEKVYQAQIGV